ncbi:MAG: BlaI/MecI/CopY family transcriptional regulator [FCB group bacterium]|jgi:BlaI family penicillinase repressor|nr:BlaI/MecI/CopY family transcriptional regulator [FCB group bacterium]
MKKPKQNPEAPRLSEMEWEVMKPLWEHGPLAARDIYEKIPDSYGWAYRTVKTMLARLVKKGALAYDQIGNSYLYRAVYDRSEMSREATQSFVRRVFDGALAPFLAQFAQHVSDEELEVLRAELARASRERAKVPKPGREKKG